MESGWSARQDAVWSACGRTANEAICISNIKREARIAGSADTSRNAVRRVRREGGPYPSGSCNGSRYFGCSRQIVTWRLCDANLRMEPPSIATHYKRWRSFLTNAWIKDKLGLRKFHVRGLVKAGSELLWACLTYNIMQWERLKWRQDDGSVRHGDASAGPPASEAGLWREGEKDTQNQKRRARCGGPIWGEELALRWRRKLADFQHCSN